MESSGRFIEVELNGQETITIELDDLEPNPDEVLELLKDGQCKVWVWTTLATEYWRKGFLDAAEKIAETAVNAFDSTGDMAAFPPIYSLLSNIQITRARTAPKINLSTAREDILKERLKEEYYKESAQYLNLSARTLSVGSSETHSNSLAFLTRGIQQLATRNMDDAMRSFEGVLSEKPTNVVALLGKARILYQKRQYTHALQAFQQVLRYNPRCQPDPRIGIGLCFWALESRANAKAAWERSLELNPNEWAAQLLLGLEALNSSKNENQNEGERTRAFLMGTKFIEKAFKAAGQKSAAAANVLSELMILKGQGKRALKLAERTIQFADTLSVLNEGYIRAARVLHSEGAIDLSSQYFGVALETQPKNLLGAIGLAQMQLKKKDIPSAIKTLEALIKPPNPQRSLEANVMLASLQAYIRTKMSKEETDTQLASARGLFDSAVKGSESHTNGNGSGKFSRALSEDIEMYLEIGKLWRTDNLSRTAQALMEALRISEGSGTVDPRLLNNLGALLQLEEKYSEAREYYERALTTATGLDPESSEAMSTSILYNLARVYEEQGQDSLAQDAYEKLLSRHPEYVDAKIRLAYMLFNIHRHTDAHELLKQCLISENSNLNLRAFYTHFLVHTNTLKPAKDFVFSTLKDHDKHDLYALCAAGWIMYHQARESRDTTPEGIKERRRGFQRSAEFYEKALTLDSCCAVAAQGLAIITAEDALGSFLQPHGTSADDESRRKGIADGIDIFSKVRESLSDGSVYVNLGHCMYLADKYDRSIENYESASTRFYSGKNISVLVCLSRAWYAKGIKDASYAAMSAAFKCAQQALHLQPSDKAILYNMTVIQQKTAEILFGILPAKRNLVELQYTVDQAKHAQKIFAALAEDTSPQVPYSREIADQRRKYGDRMLSKSEVHLEAQRKYEDEERARLDAARKRRQEEQDRIEAQKYDENEKRRIANELLSEKRRAQREEAMEWTKFVVDRVGSDDEKEKRPKRSKKPKVEDENAEDGVMEPKKKRRRKLRKGADNGQDDEPQEERAMFTEEEDGDEKPAKKRKTKKQMVRDDDDDAVADSRPKKQFKSKEVLSDTDEEME